MKKLILFLFLSFVFIPMSAFVANIDDIRYEVSNGEATIVDASRIQYSTLYIPRTITVADSTYNVVRIGRRAFDSSFKVEKIHIPESVRFIEEYAFKDCINLKEIHLPSTILKLPKGCFWGCEQLTSVKLPESLQEMEDDIFRMCSSLETISIPDNVRKIGSCIFHYCRKLTSIELGSSLTELPVWLLKESPGVKELKVKSEIPPTIDETVIPFYLVKVVKIYVPAKSRQLYKDHELWGKMNIN